jgi:tripartite-type tricarboxylate transporter receptor subunit TctC
MKRCVLAAFAAFFLSCSAAAQEDKFPNHPIRVIVPFTPGAGSDIAARFFGDQLSGVLRVPVVVENKPGAFGAVAVGAVKSSPADGYTLLLGGNSPVVVNPLFVADLSYDPVKELKPVSGLARNTNVFIVPASSPIHSIADLVHAAKMGKRPLNVGTPASGYQLVMEWFARESGAKFNHIPYKGGAQCYTDVVGGQLDMAVAELAGTLELIKTGKLRALATTGETRHPSLPDVPTVKESGFPDFVTYSWNSLYVRAETPEAVTKKLSDAMQRVLATDAARQFVKLAGTELMPLDRHAMRKFQMEEAARFKSIADAAGIKPQ